MEMQDRLEDITIGCVSLGRRSDGRLRFAAGRFEMLCYIFDSRCVVWSMDVFKLLPFGFWWASDVMWSSTMTPTFIPSSDLLLTYNWWWWYLTLLYGLYGYAASLRGTVSLQRTHDMTHTRYEIRFPRAIILPCNDYCHCYLLYKTQNTTWTGQCRKDIQYSPGRVTSSYNNNTIVSWHAWKP